jgi:hypothetical protein
MIDRKGVTRLVFVFDNFVIKIPNFSVQHSHFLAGCYANFKERCYWKSWKGYPPLQDRVVPTLFCSCFGLFQIQARAAILNNDASLNDHEIEYFSFTTDTKPSNFGYYKNRLVCVDYA